VVVAEVAETPAATPSKAAAAGRASARRGAAVKAEPADG
jgi:hypothetical protein